MPPLATWASAWSSTVVRRTLTDTGVPPDLVEPLQVHLARTNTHPQGNLETLVRWLLRDPGPGPQESAQALLEDLAAHAAAWGPEARADSILWPVKLPSQQLVVSPAPTPSYPLIMAVDRLVNATRLTRYEALIIAKVLQNFGPPDLPGAANALIGFLKEADDAPSEADEIASRLMRRHAVTGGARPADLDYRRWCMCWLEPWEGKYPEEDAAWAARCIPCNAPAPAAGH